MPKGRRIPESVPATVRLPFRLGVIPGATPGKWIDMWRERRSNPLQLIPLTTQGQRHALTAGDVDAAIVRLPIDRDGLHLIPLYDEIAVVMMDAESPLTAADEVTASDLAGEVIITAADDVLHLPPPAGSHIPGFALPRTTGDAVALVAAGLGVLIVPMSLARLHHRRDVEHRLLSEGPLSSVGLAWYADRTTPDVETFVGIVRGRTANSSR